MSTLPFKPARLRVLVGDEHDLMRKSIDRVLTRIGFENIVEVHHGRDIKRIIDVEIFDLYILDLYFSDADGFDILQMIRAKDVRADIPIIAVTGESNRDDIVKAIDSGASDYILKPFQPEDLEKKIISVLTAYQSPSPTVKIIRKIEALIQRNDLEKAFAALEKMVAKKPNNPALLHLLALVIFKQGNIMEKRVGAMTREALEGLIKQYI